MMFAVNEGFYRVNFRMYAVRSVRRSRNEEENKGQPVIRRCWRAVRCLLHHSNVEFEPQKSRAMTGIFRQEINARLALESGLNITPKSILNDSNTVLLLPHLIFLCCTGHATRHKLKNFRRLLGLINPSNVPSRQLNRGVPPSFPIPEERRVENIDR